MYAYTGFYGANVVAIPYDNNAVAAYLTKAEIHFHRIIIRNQYVIIHLFDRFDR